MNKKLYFSVFISLMCIFFAVISVILVFEVRNLTMNSANEKLEVEKTDIKAENIAAEQTGYVVISEDDGVNLYSVFANGERKFIKSLDISTATMRNADRKAFERGIKLNNENDILHLIEDYTS